MARKSLDKKINKKLKAHEVLTQSDLMHYLGSAAIHRWNITENQLINWMTSNGLDTSSLTSLRSRVGQVPEYDLAQLVSEADSYLETGKRSVTGSYYTPATWVWYMTRVSLGDYVASLMGIEPDEGLELVLSWSDGAAHETTLQKISKKQYIQVLENIRMIKVIDIACGAGAFLIEMVDLLSNIDRQLSLYLKNPLKKVKSAQSYAVENVFGIDLQSYPLSVYAMSLIWRYGPDLMGAGNLPVYIANSLMPDVYNSPEIREVALQGGFDIVIGNPPYLGEKGNTAVFKEIRNTPFGSAHYEGKMDLSYFFTLKGLEILKPTGRLIYLTTNYFITADGAVKYRESLKAHTDFKYILNFNTYPVFKDALGQHNMIYMLGMKSENNLHEENKAQATAKRPQMDDPVKINKLTKVDYVLGHIVDEKIDLLPRDLIEKKYDGQYVNTYFCDRASVYSSDGTIRVLSDYNHSEAMEIYQDFCNGRLKDVFNINQGIVSGADQVSKLMLTSKFRSETVEKFKVQKGDPIFVFEKGEAEKAGVDTCFLRPFYKNSDIGLYTVQPRTFREICYIEDYIEDFESNYQSTHNHLQKYKEVLEMRREVQTGTRPWYGLQWPRDASVFEGEKIVVPQRSRINRFAYTELPFYSSADVYYFKDKAMKYESRLSKKAWMYYLGLLNTSIIYMWLYHNGKRKGDLLELYAKPLLETQIPMYSAMNWQMEVAAYTEKIITLLDQKKQSEAKKYMHKIDECMYDAMQMTTDMRKTITNFHIR